MNKLISYFVLALFSGAYIICSDSALMKAVSKIKLSTNIPFFSSDKNRYGDLFGISYLSHFKKLVSDIPLKTRGGKSGSFSMYVIGDSYVIKQIQENNFSNAQQITAADFSNVDTIYFAHWNDKRPFKLDPAKTNILIAETVERLFFERLIDLSPARYAFDNNLANKKPVGSGRYSPVRDFLFNKKINSNLEFILFDNSFFTLIKQIRADVNLAFFNRIPPAVTFRANIPRLFLSETIDTTSMGSSFRVFRDNDFKKCMANCNAMATHYKNAGFDKVYISVIPNPVTIAGYDNCRYNGLIPRIQSGPERKFETIDVYPDFLSSKVPLYHLSDSHWNTHGEQIWVDKVDKVLIDESAGK